MVIHETILTDNPCYKSGHKITPKAIMLGSVRGPQPSAKVYVHNWNCESTKNTRCAHALIDANSGDVYQLLPWNHRAWHSGKHPKTKMSSNGTHIAILMCEPAQIRYKKGDVFDLVGNADMAADAVKRTYDSAVELCAYLCKKFNINPKTGIISHGEGYENGVASNHADPVHLWNGLNTSYTMDSFRNDVAEKIRTDQGTNEFVKEETKKEIAQSKEVEVAKIGEMKVRIDVERLRIRSGPGTDNAPTGKYTGKGTFVITEVQNGTGSINGWGKLRNGIGWINLDYVEVL